MKKKKASGIPVAMLMKCCLLALAAWLSVSCGEKVPDPTPLKINIPRGFPTLLNIPDDNPMTVEGVELGRLLFNDPHLCGHTGSDPDSLMSCATCHRRENNFDIGIDNPRFPGGVATGRGSGVKTAHNVMPLANLVFNNSGYFWNGYISSNNPRSDRRNIEDIVLMAIIAEDEMNGTAESAVAAIRADKKYPPLFEKAFGTPEVNIERIQKAIAQYVRTLVSANSKFDRYLQGLEQLTEEELHGYVLFATEEGADCYHCHGGDGSPLFTTNLFYNNALDATPADSLDRFSVTFNGNDRGAYRAPSLRNVAVSAPYMHDGRFKTLDEVLEFYNTGLQPTPYASPLMHKINDGGALLSPKDIADLKAFLLTLTDDEFLGK